MVHDKYCELNRKGKTCHCASRAYDRDPILGLPNPYQINSDDMDEFIEWMER